LQKTQLTGTEEQKSAEKRSADLQKRNADLQKRNADIERIEKIFDKFAYKVDRARLYSDFFAILAYRISNAVDGRHRTERTKALAEIEKHYDAGDRALLDEAIRELMNIYLRIVDGERECSDVLGELFMRSQTASSKTGQFFTPFDVSRLCAEITVSNNAEHIIASQLGKNLAAGLAEGPGFVTLEEPTCGSGGMVLAVADTLTQKFGINVTQSLLVHAADIDARCVHMAYIQMSLMGIPAVIHHRDTLSLETWGEWHTPALCFNWMRFFRTVRQFT